MVVRVCWMAHQCPMNPYEVYGRVVATKGYDALKDPAFPEDVQGVHRLEFSLDTLNDATYLYLGNISDVTGPNAPLAVTFQMTPGGRFVDALSVAIMQAAQIRRLEGMLEPTSEKTSA